MKYKIIYQENNKIKKIYTDNLNNVPKNIIKIQKDEKKRQFLKQQKISNKKLNYFFKDLNIMLDANISLKDSFSILIKNRKCEKQKSLAKLLLNSLNGKESIEKRLQDFKMDSLIYSFFNIINKQGNLKLTIKALSELISFKVELTSKLLKMLSYPVLLLFTLMLSLFSIFYFVLPSFENLISQNSLKATTSTILLFGLKDFLFSYSHIFFISFAAFIFLTLSFYRLNSKIAYFFDRLFLENIPIFSSMILTYELYKIFIVLNILQKADYEFHNSIKSLYVLVKNKYLLDKIAQIENQLKSGRSISVSFESVNLFDEVVLNLIQTGEVSNQMGFVTNEIEKIYNKKFQDKVKLFSFWIQPIVFLIIMGLILWIIFAIFMPMWNMSDMIMM